VLAVQELFTSGGRFDMAHFAQVNNNIVEQVIVVANSDCDDLPFPDSEPIGQAFIASLGIEGEWLQTSYNGNFRGTYAGIGFTFAAGLGEYGEFIAPLPAPEPEPITPTVKK
jgi:hypothetical protein